MNQKLIVSVMNPILGWLIKYFLGLTFMFVPYPKSDHPISIENLKENTYIIDCEDINQIQICDEFGETIEIIQNTIYK